MNPKGNSSLSWQSVSDYHGCHVKATVHQGVVYLSKNSRLTDTHMCSNPCEAFPKIRSQVWRDCGALGGDKERMKEEETTNRSARCEMGCILALRTVPWSSRVGEMEGDRRSNIGCELLNFGE